MFDKLSPIDGKITGAGTLDQRSRTEKDRLDLDVIRCLHLVWVYGGFFRTNAMRSADCVYMSAI